MCFFWAISRRVRCSLHAQAHTALFDRPFLKRSVFHGETITKRAIQAGDHVEKFLSVDAALMQEAEAI
jgi:hypothetical protein